MAAAQLGVGPASRAPVPWESKVCCSTGIRPDSVHPPMCGSHMAESHMANAGEHAPCHRRARSTGGPRERERPLFRTYLRFRALAGAGPMTPVPHM